MAASQHLHPGSLLDAVQSQFTPDIIRSASTMVGESESVTGQALNGGASSVLTGLTNMASSREAAGNLAGLMRGGDDAAAAENVHSLFSEAGPSASMLAAGQQLLDKIFGDKSSSVADLLAKWSGVTPSSATRLLSLTAPLALGVLGKRASAQGLDASGMASALLGEKSDIDAAAPAGLSQLLAGGPTIVSKPTDATTERLAEPVHLERVQAEEPSKEALEGEGARPMRWLPLSLAALARRMTGWKRP